jgi:hypothetical protein
MNTIEIRRSRRKTLSIEVTAEQKVIVRAPMRMSRAVIDAFVKEKAAWIAESLRKMEARSRERSAVERLTEQELRALAGQAAAEFAKKTEWYAAQIGVTYGRITIRSQKTRWGSCSAKGNLNFNCLLMLAPEEVRDYVVVHELCHRRQMNHSPRFWNEVASILPHYREQRAWLKANGPNLIARLPENV